MADRKMYDKVEPSAAAVVPRSDLDGGVSVSHSFSWNGISCKDVRTGADNWKTL